MHYRYSLIHESLFRPDIGSYHSGGIVVVNGSGSPIRRISDISTDSKRLPGPVSGCNRLELDVCQLHDVVEDYLGA